MMEIDKTRGRLGWVGVVLFMVVVCAVIVAVRRFVFGIGAVSNLSQGYPWGFWIGFDVLAMIALAAGGFVTAAIVHLFGGHKYHVLSRPAILMALVGYTMYVFGLLVDIGRPWMIWSMMINWQHESPMFEVGWCVMMYLTVLVLEFLPVVFEKFGWDGLMAVWRKLAPVAVIGMMCLFAFLMTHSLIWTACITAGLIIIQMLLAMRVLPRDPHVPTMVIMAGVIFSTMHQSSLGTMMLMVPHKLDAVWYTPILPVLFLMSSVMSGLAMILVVMVLLSRVFKQKVDLSVLRDIGGVLSFAILAYLAVKSIDIVVRGATPEVLAWTPVAVAFWVEVGLGLLLPLAFLMTPELANSRNGLLTAGLFAVIGVVLNRMNVAVTGISADLGPQYVPALQEVAISAGLLCGAILLYVTICRFFPILPQPKVKQAQG